MARWPKTGTVFVSILILLIVAAGCGSENENSPENTVNTLLNAYEDLDFDTILNCLVPEAEERTEIEEVFNSMKDMDISFSITNRDVNIISQTDDTATLSVSFTMKGTVEDEVNTETVDETWTLVKRDDDWLITGFP